MKNKIVVLSLFFSSLFLMAANNHKSEKLLDLARLQSIDDPVVIIDEKEKAAKLVKKVDPDLDEFVNIIKKTNSLLADFTQTEENLLESTSNKKKVLKGKLKLAKPDKLWWEIISPDQERQIYATNGSKFWHYDKGLEQVVIDKYDSKRIVNSPLYFLLVNVDNLTANYIVKKIGNNIFELNPSNATALESNYTSHLQLKFNSKNSQLIQVSFIAAQNKRITIDLDNIKTNTGISKELFNFKVPTGIDIIDAAELY
jgi:chaperone LolA